VQKTVAKAFASVAFMAMAGFGVTACGNDPGYVDNGYDQVWDHGHYVYVPHSYYLSHKSQYRNSAHPVRHRSSSYVTTHHVKVTHRTTTTVNKDGSRTTTRHTTTRRTTRKSSGFGGSRSTRRR
jgi:hypothetical protein